MTADYWPLQQLAVVALLFTLPGLLPSLALLGRTWMLLAAVPLLSAVFASVAGTAMLLIGVEQLPAWVVVVLLANAAAVVRLRVTRRSRATHRSQAGPRTNPVAVALVVAGALAPLVALRRPDVAWDTRSIWLLHARWFYGGPDVLEASLANPAFAFSHSSYPPLSAASSSLAWQVIGFEPEAYRVAQLLTAGLTACALVAVGLALVLTATRRLAPLAALLSVAVSLAAHGFAGRFSSSGYVDLLWAAAAAAAALLMVSAAPSGFRNRTVLVLAVAAGLTKNEGTGIALLLISWVAISAWRAGQRSGSAQAGLAAVLVLAWPLAARAVVPESVLGEARPLTAGEATYALGIVTHWVGLLVAAALVLVLVAGVLDRRLARGTAGLVALALFAAFAVAFAQMRMGFFRLAVQPETIRDAEWVLDHTQRYYTFSRLVLTAALAHGVLRLLRVVTGEADAGPVAENAGLGDWAPRPPVLRSPS